MNGIPLTSPLERARNPGFTLLEMCIVLVIISFLLVGAMVVFTQSIAVKQVNDTTARLATIQTALYNFRLAKGRLPCPADVTLGTAATYFGLEAISPGDCSGGVNVSTYDVTTGRVIAYGTGVPYATYSQMVSSSITGNLSTATSTATVSAMTGIKVGMGVSGDGIPSGVTVTAVGGGSITLTATPTKTASNVPLTFETIAVGMVPMRTLGLPDDYGFDSWGRRLMYAVAKDMTQSGAFGLFSASDPRARITVTGLIGNATTQALYVAWSYGPNGHGGYPRSGGTNLVSVGSVNADELQNCHCDSTVPNVNSTNLDTTFVQKEPYSDPTDPDNFTKTFDDILVYGTRQSLLPQSALYWNPVPASASRLVCAQNNLVCTTTGMVRSCYCNQ